jgi:hypothetical protein
MCQAYASMGTYVTRQMLSTSVSRTTLKRLKRFSKDTGIPISRFIDDMTAERFAAYYGSIEKSQGIVPAVQFLSRVVEMNEKKKLEGSKLEGDTQPAESHEGSEAQE